jgi:hypothetical protein
MIFQIDVRHLLSAIRVPTLVVYRTADIQHAAGSRYLGAHIPGAKVVELPGNDYFPYLGDQDAILDEIEEFLTGVRPVPAPDRALAMKHPAQTDRRSDVAVPQSLGVGVRCFL